LTSARPYRKKTIFRLPDNSLEGLDEAIDGTEQSAAGSSETTIPAYLVTVR
jgi:hypothetical protein